MLFVRALGVPVSVATPLKSGSVMHKHLFLLFGFIIWNLSAGIYTSRAETLEYPVGYRILDLEYSQTHSRGTLTVAVWYPTDSSPEPFTYGGPTKGNVALDGKPQAGRFPFLMLSHGYGGSGLAVQFFAENLARRGWIVAAPDHHDSDTAIRIRGGRPSNFSGRRMLQNVIQITKSGPATRKQYLYRLDELSVALNGTLKSPHVRNFIDTTRIAVGGHSLGGFTALGLCGTLPERRDPRIKAAVIFSSAVSGYLYTDEERRRIRMPVMLMFGERERTQVRGGRAMEDIESAFFNSLRPPKYFAEVKDGTHFSFNNTFSDTLLGRSFGGIPQEFAVINRYATAFLEYYVAGRSDLTHVLDSSDPRLSRFSRALP